MDLDPPEAKESPGTSKHPLGSWQLSILCGLTYFGSHLSPEPSDDDDDHEDGVMGTPAHSLSQALLQTFLYSTVRWGLSMSL